MSERVSVGKLTIEKQLHDLVQSEVLPGTGIENEAFWGSLADLLDAFGPRNKAALEHRALLQTRLNDWHKSNPQGGMKARVSAYLLAMWIRKSQPLPARNS